MLVSILCLLPTPPLFLSLFVSCILLPFSLSILSLFPPQLLCLPLAASGLCQICVKLEAYLSSVSEAVGPRELLSMVAQCDGSTGAGGSWDGGGHTEGW